MMLSSSQHFKFLIQRRHLSTHMISRLNDFERLKKSSFWQNSQHSSSKSNINVSLTFKDEMICERMSVESHVTLQDLINEKMSKKTSKRLVAASVNGVLRDLSSSLTESENHVELHDFESDVGTETLWHSASHVLGYALEKQYGDTIALCDGPALRLAEGGSGFFYEMRLLSNDLKISPDDIPDLEAHMKDFVRQNHAFERLRVSKEDALKMFESNRLKREFIENIDESEDEITLYRCGDFVDLCRGPHVPRTGLIQAHKLLNVSGAHHDDENVRLSRAYGVAFENRKRLRAWEKLQEDAKRRDHRRIGTAQNLFMFHPTSPGNVFWLPHGMHIYQKLLTFLRDKYRSCGYDEVSTPLMLNTSIWRQSGHWDHYSENMFEVRPANSQDKDYDETETMGLKPMNCPAHCLVYKHILRSYRDLPLRVADFSTLHRNEISGSLGGLTRLRQFHQDDAHIFCRQDQIESEISSCLEFVRGVYVCSYHSLIFRSLEQHFNRYGVFGFEEPEFRLSTRPEEYVGHSEDWDDAEDSLRKALDRADTSWTLNPGDGAFYGPKIDVAVTDALKRRHQCATIQLDFQLPKRFELS